MTDEERWSRASALVRDLLAGQGHDEETLAAVTGRVVKAVTLRPPSKSKNKILQGLREAVAYAKGDDTTARVSVIPVKRT